MGPSPPFTLRTADGRAAALRDARPEDARGHLAAIRTVVTERPRTLLVQAEELWTEEEFATRCRPWGPLGAQLEVEIDRTIVGALSIHRRGMLANSHVAEFGLFLVAGARGIGLGRALLAVVDHWADAFEVTRIEMPVFVHNERAQRLYRSMGYEVEGHEREAVKFPEGFVDEVRMAKLRTVDPPR